MQGAFVYEFCFRFAVGKGRFDRDPSFRFAFAFTCVSGIPF
jgi:hypothetical protein